MRVSRSKTTPGDRSRHDELLQGTRPEADARLIRDILGSADPEPDESAQDGVGGGAETPLVVTRPAERPELKKISPRG
jgi:hypothetical protein